MPRFFIGWPLPEPLRHDLGETARRLREQLPAGSWTRPETYHLTFAFLGDQGEAIIPALEKALAEGLGELPPATTSIGTAGFFPSERRPRVGWLGLEDADAVERIASSVRQALDLCSIDYDRKPFRSHLTLARPKAAWKQDETRRFIEGWKAHRDTPLLVDSAVLFESQLGSAGARHIERLRVQCGR